MSFPGPINDTWLLEDGAAAVTASRAGQVASGPRVFDCGADTLFDGFLIFDVSAIDTTGDRVYGLKLQASNSATFASGVIDLIAPALNLAGEGDQAVVVTNQVVDTKYRYLRLWIEVDGTAPSITLSAWLSHKDSLDDYSLAQLTGLLAVAATRFSNASQEFRAWAGGVIDGGPNSDGDYPLSDGFGNTHLVACPAKIAATAGLSYEAINSLTARTAPFAHDHNGPDIPFIADGNLRKGKLFLFASRRTADLQEVTIGDSGVDYHMQVLNTDTGVSHRASVNELRKLANGIIDPTLPPYNCKFDAVFTRGVITQNGNNVLEFIEPVGSRAKVGHHLQLSNAYGGGPGSTSITEVIDDYHVRVANAPTTSHGGMDCLFGTDDTAGLQAALYDARAPSTYTYGKVVWMPAGMALTGSLIYYPRTALFGKGVRQTTLIRKDDGARSPAWYEYWQEYGSTGLANEDHPDFVGNDNAPLLRAENRYVDFPAMGDFAIFGARWCQTKAYGGLSLLAYMFGAPGPQLPQVDCYPMFSRMHIWQTGWHALEHSGQHSGSIFAVEIMNSGGAGFHMAGYDANITNILIIGCDMPGMVFVDRGDNSNLLNVKLSFNGVNGAWLYGERGNTNLLMEGNGNNITNMRVQESKGSNLWIRGDGNQFADTMLDDTGCIVPHHNTWDTKPALGAAIVLDGANYNRFNDIQFGGAVHKAHNYATHAIYCLNNPQHNSGRVESKNFPKYDDSAYFDNGQTGGLAPRAVNTSDAGGIDASNRITIDDEPLSFYYP